MHGDRNHKEEVMSENKRDFKPFFEMFLVLATIIGSTLPLYLHTDSKMMTLINEQRKEMAEYRKEANEILKEIQEEMNNLHGRLCAIEESRR
jgi:DNA-binding transcriptional MerR regulator